jgi:hypothetical protein
MGLEQIVSQLAVALFVASRAVGPEDLNYKPPELLKPTLLELYAF